MGRLKTRVAPSTVPQLVCVGDSSFPAQRSRGIHTPTRINPASINPASILADASARRTTVAGRLSDQPTRL